MRHLLFVSITYIILFLFAFNKVVPLTTSQNYLEKALLARIVNTGIRKNDAATKSVSPRAGSKVA